MAQKKLKRFEEIKSFPNVLEYPESMNGKWNEFFKNEYPITLELACGKGEYTIGLARLYPAKNFIGVDIKGNRIWVGASFALKNNLRNAAFLRTDIDKIYNYFSANEIDEIWITFPDPQLRVSKAKKRLTHPMFLRLYQKILKPKGKIHLKTDSPDLYHFTKLVIELYALNLHADIENIWQNEIVSQELKITTFYESLDIAKSKSIFYLSFSLPPVISDNDSSLTNLLKKKNE
jgi:tRNA (guanine-N7-)-methyltransferase